ncbi:hypothetical protein KBD13_00305 [Patescibacteria group bacterium]|nr:hypothetical protein [Patescibacteria group bacterium]MDQ5919316.1 hypothetical protein [Patescibacteria group bacterium]
MRLSARQKRARLLTDAVIIVGSIVVATALVQTGVIHAAVHGVRDLAYAGSFLAGLFFTSLFTIAPSIATLGVLAQEQAPISVAVFGGLGAMCGDLILYLFVRDRVSEDFAYLLRSPRAKRWKAVVASRVPRVLWPMFGAMIIASPLPDEIGVAMMWLSKMRLGIFLPVTFFANGLGIYGVALVARALHG